METRLQQGPGSAAVTAGTGEEPQPVVAGRWSRLVRPRLPYVFMALVYLFLFVPILVVALTSFNPTGVAGVPVDGLTLEWYRELRRDERLIDALTTSLLIALLAALITALLGLLLAYQINLRSLQLRRAIQGFVFLPTLIPGVVIGIALVSWFNRIGLSTGFLSILIAHVLVALPFTTTIILTSFYGFDQRLLEASRDLGAGEWRTFRNVTLPLVLPGVISGALIAFTISFDEFVVTFFVAGGGVMTLPIEIYSRIRFLHSPVINAVSTLVLVISMLLIVAGQMLALRRRGQE